jgi:PadR family transcriptional regulator, regulatory protein PadR
LSTKEELIMLTMLHQERYGTEMMEMVSLLSEGRVEINFGSLYPILKKLSKGGLIEDVKSPSVEDSLVERGGHRRKYYALTEPGREALNQLSEMRTSLRSISGQWQACV